MSFSARLFSAVKIAGATHRLIATSLMIAVLLSEAYRFGRNKVRQRVERDR